MYHTRKRPDSGSGVQTSHHKIETKKETEKFHHFQIEILFLRKKKKRFELRRWYIGVYAESFSFRLKKKREQDRMKSKEGRKKKITPGNERGEREAHPIISWNKKKKGPISIRNSAPATTTTSHGERHIRAFSFLTLSHILLCFFPPPPQKKKKNTTIASAI